MNLQQLRIVRETVRRNFNLTEVANSLFTSQSGVSKHIKDLEDELGVELFIRRGKRLLGLTDPGKEMVEIVERILGIERTEGLVQQQHARPDGERPRQGDALPLPARELCGVAMRQPAELNELQKLRHALGDLGLRRAHRARLDAHAEGDVLVDRHVRGQPPPRREPGGVAKNLDRAVRRNLGW